MFKFPLLLVVLTLALLGCSEPTSPTDPGTTPIDTAKKDATKKAYDSLRKPEATGVFVDKRDNRSYKWVQVGNYRVFAENLAYSPKHGKTFIYTNDTIDTTKSLKVFGRAYDYEAIVDSTTLGVWAAGQQGACPEGWWVPTSSIWTNFATRPKNAFYTGHNPVLDSTFNNWAFSLSEGGSNTLGLNFSKTFGTDFDCDTAEFYADSISNCKEAKRLLTSYAAIDTTSINANVYDKIIVQVATLYRYNVYKLNYNRSVSSSTFTRSLGYGNSVIRRKFSDFSYIRCFQHIQTP